MMKKLLVMAFIAIASLSAGNVMAQNTTKASKKNATEQTCNTNCPEAKAECTQPKAKAECTKNECPTTKEECKATKNCKSDKKCSQSTGDKSAKTKK